jgi:hypothetical protein
MANVYIALSHQQPMRWVSLLFGLIMFVWSSVFRFMHHKPENRGAYIDNQKCPFCEVVKMYNGLHHCIPLVEVVKNIYGTSNLESRWESYASKKIYELLVLLVREGLAQIWTTCTTSPRPVLQMDGGRWRSLAWKWTIDTTGPWPVLPVEPDQKYR